MANMTKDGEGTRGLRVKCPGGDYTCDWTILEKDWSHQFITDHQCPDGHWFRVEGDNSDDLSMFDFYSIKPTEIRFINLC